MIRLARIAGIAAGVSVGLALLLVLLLPRWVATPSWINDEPTASIVILDRQGDRLAEIPAAPGVHRESASIVECDSLLIRATLAAEDRRFERHPGVDPIALARAVLRSLRDGGSIRGASTITMQTVRLARGAPGGLLDRLREIAWSLVLDAHWSKSRILESYLNRAPYGRGITGVAAASRYWLGKPPAVLSPAEAALLAALPSAPSRLDPARHPARAREARNRVLARMERLGWISAEDSRRARAANLEIEARSRVHRAPHFAAWIEETARESPGGIARIRTTLQPAIQAIAEQALSRRVRALRHRRIAGGAVVVLDSRNAELLAMVGSPDWRSPEAGQFNAALAPRQPGSAVKPFTYAVAFAESLRPSTILADVPVSYEGPGGSFAPRNYSGKFAGPVPARLALANSWNVPAVEVLRRADPAAVAAGFQSLGLEIDDPSRLGLGLTLGAGEVSLLDLAAAYATLARGGLWIAPKAIEEIEDPDGRVRPGPPQARREALDAISCSWVNEILSDPSARGDAFYRDGPLEMAGPVAAKTGTSSDWRDAWAIFYTTRHTVAVWMGNPDGTPTDEVTGAQGPAFVAREILEAAEGADPAAPFPVPDGVERRPVCPVSGGAAGPDCANADFEPFRVGDPPLEPCDAHRAYRIDVTNGLLARACTPSELVRRRVFVELSERFAFWQSDEGIAPVPQEATLCRCGRPGCRILDGDRSLAPRARVTKVAILRPAAGTVLAIDPTIPPLQQQLALEASAPAGSLLRWKIDGREIGRTRAAHRLYWSPAAGRHEIVVEILQGGSGSDATVLTVLEADDRS